jgi:hypothetical protein
MRNKASSWVALGNQMDGLDERDRVDAAYLGLTR